jgi:hypothetical protein
VANSRVPKISVLKLIVRDWMEDVARAHLFVQLVHALNDDPATGRPRDERLRSGAHRLLERLSLAPSLVASFPEVQDGIVAAEHGEAPVVMKHFEPQPIAIEVDRRRRVSHWKRRDRLPESCHARSPAIYSVTTGPRGPIGYAAES